MKRYDNWRRREAHHRVWTYPLRDHHQSTKDQYRIREWETAQLIKRMVWRIQCRRCRNHKRVTCKALDKISKLTKTSELHSKWSLVIMELNRIRLRKSWRIFRAVYGCRSLKKTIPDSLRRSLKRSISRGKAYAILSHQDLPSKEFETSLSKSWAKASWVLKSWRQVVLVGHFWDHRWSSLNKLLLLLGARSRSRMALKSTLDLPIRKNNHLLNQVSQTKSMRIETRRPRWQQKRRIHSWATKCGQVLMCKTLQMLTTICSRQAKHLVQIRLTWSLTLQEMRSIRLPTIQDRQSTQKICKTTRANRKGLKAFPRAVQ